MATSSFFKNLELSKEVAEEQIKMTEEDFSVNKVLNLEYKEADIKEIGEKFKLRKKEKNNWRVRIYIRRIESYDNGTEINFKQNKKLKKIIYRINILYYNKYSKTDLKSNTKAMIILLRL